MIGSSKSLASATQINTNDEVDIVSTSNETVTIKNSMIIMGVYQVYPNLNIDILIVIVKLSPDTTVSCVVGADRNSIDITLNWTNDMFDTMDDLISKLDREARVPLMKGIVSKNGGELPTTYMNIKIPITLELNYHLDYHIDNKNRLIIKATSPNNLRTKAIKVSTSKYSQRVKY